MASTVQLSIRFKRPIGQEYGVVMNGQMVDVSMTEYDYIGSPSEHLASVRRSAHSCIDWPCLAVVKVNNPASTARIAPGYSQKEP